MTMRRSSSVSHLTIRSSAHFHSALALQHQGNTMTRKSKICSASTARKIGRDSIKYKKSPEAPRRFKSAYMFFSTEKHKEIRKEMGNKEVSILSRS
jgi:hypothetical protein